MTSGEVECTSFRGAFGGSGPPRSGGKPQGASREAREARGGGAPAHWV